MVYMYVVVVVIFFLFIQVERVSSSEPNCVEMPNLHPSRKLTTAQGLCTNQNSQHCVHSVRFNCVCEMCGGMCVVSSTVGRGGHINIFMSTSAYVLQMGQW